MFRPRGTGELDDVQSIGLREIAWCAGTAILIYVLLTAAFILAGGAA